jgi:hypothetical protein
MPKVIVVHATYGCDTGCCGKEHVKDIDFDDCIVVDDQ